MALFWNFPLFCNFPLMICNFPLFSFFNIRIADRTWNWQLSNVSIYALILSLRVCVYFDFKKWRVDFSCCPTKIYKNFQTVLIIKILRKALIIGSFIHLWQWVFTITVNFKLLEFKVVCCVYIYLFLLQKEDMLMLFLNYFCVIFTSFASTLGPCHHVINQESHV